MQRWTSDPLTIPQHSGPFAAANLEFEDVRHDGPSLSVALYFNNPDVDPEAGEAGDGYIDELRIFGHGKCWGGVGHCDTPPGAIHDFDTRPPHPLTPINITVDCTAALRALGGREQATVTALAFAQGGEEKDEGLLRFSRLCLITYD